MTANSPPSATATATEMAEATVITALEFLGGAVMAETAELDDGATEVLPAKAPAAKERRS